METTFMTKEPISVGSNGSASSSERAMAQPAARSDHKGGGVPYEQLEVEEGKGAGSSYGATQSSEALSGRESTDLMSRSSSVSPQLDAPELYCDCHQRRTDTTNKKARNKLIIASIAALLFMVIEIIGLIKDYIITKVVAMETTIFVVGGSFSNSLAILTDAAHMLSDFSGFLISLFAIWVGTRPPSRRFSFGWHRAEVMGALVSVLIIWVLTGILVYEAAERVVSKNFEINADIMLITACVGVYMNVFLLLVLQPEHGHSHGSVDRRSKTRDQEVAAKEQEQESELEEKAERPTSNGKKKKKEGSRHRNINVRAAFIHVIGDLIQSVGVVIAGYVIWFKPEWKLVDPICTFVFSILVLFSTLNILKDALHVLMEGTPTHIDYESVKGDLIEIPGVKHAHNLRIWSLTTNNVALAAHLALEAGADNQDVLNRATQMLKQKYSIHQTTLQVEEYQDMMGECRTCRDEKPPQKQFSFSWPW